MSVSYSVFKNDMEFMTLLLTYLTSLVASEPVQERREGPS